MPRFDGRGPMWGGGPGAGWGMGPCGAGWHHGFGRRYGGYGYQQYSSPKSELAALEDAEQALTEELEALRKEKAALKGSRK